MKLVLLSLPRAHAVKWPRDKRTTASIRDRIVRSTNHYQIVRVIPGEVRTEAAPNSCLFPNTYLSNMLSKHIPTELWGICYVTCMISTTDQQMNVIRFQQTLIIYSDVTKIHLFCSLLFFFYTSNKLLNRTNRKPLTIVTVSILSYYKFYTENNSISHSKLRCQTRSFRLTLCQHRNQCKPFVGHWVECSSQGQISKWKWDNKLYLFLTISGEILFMTDKVSPTGDEWNLTLRVFFIKKNSEIYEKQLVIKIWKTVM